jgi:hypothetical protein
VAVGIATPESSVAPKGVVPIDQSTPVIESPESSHATKFTPDTLVFHGTVNESDTENPLSDPETAVLPPIIVQALVL